MPASAPALLDLENRLARLSDEEHTRIYSKMTAAESQRKRQANLRAFVKEFHESIDSAFAQQEQELHQKLLTLVSGLQFQVYKTEEEWDQGEEVLDTPADTGRITVTLPGLSKGLNVWRSHDSYMIHAGTTLNEEDKIMVKMEGESGWSDWYSLRCNTPAHGLGENLDESGFENLCKIMEAIGITRAIKGDSMSTDDDVGVEIDGEHEALKYPLLSILLAPFGAEAMEPFRDELQELHHSYDHELGGSWFDPKV